MLTLSFAQNYYKRVSLSFHLPHLLLKTKEAVEQHDRELLQHCSPDQRISSSSKPPSLYRSCSSVILTLVFPEQTCLREEALHLLAEPEALWTVLLINAPLRMADDLRLEPDQYMTPIAQFIRAICGTVVAQRVHISRLIDELRERMNATVGIFGQAEHCDRTLLTCYSLASID